jgi:hypothetical protein
MKIELKFVWGIYLKLWAEGAKLWAEGAKLWAEAIIEVYGNVIIEWKSAVYCIVDGKDEYKKDGE